MIVYNSFIELNSFLYCSMGNNQSLAEYNGVILEKRSFMGKLWAFFKKSWFYRAIELVLAFASIFASPLISYALPSNNVPSIVNLISENQKTYGDYPVGTVKLLQSDLYYYRFDDLPMASMLRLYGANPDVAAFKIYQNEKFKITDTETGLAMSSSFVSTTVVKSDDTYSKVFFPLDEEGGNSWSLASDWTFYPEGLEIGIPVNFADSLLDKLSLPAGDYDSLLGREIRLDGNKSFPDQIYSIACVFDAFDPSFSKLPGFLGNYCLIRFENPLYMPVELYFECFDDSNGALSDFLNSLNTFFPDSTTRQEHYLSFHYQVDGEYIVDEGDETFLSSMYALRDPMNMVPMIVLGTFIVLALLFGFLLVFWLEMRSLSYAEKAMAAKFAFVSFVFGFILSCFAWLVFGGFEFANGYVVPIFTTVNLAVIFTALIVFLAFAFVSYKLSVKQTSNI